jgi:transposase
MGLPTLYALIEKASELLEVQPEIEYVDVLAAKLPDGTVRPTCAFTEAPKRPSTPIPRSFTRHGRANGQSLHREESDERKPDCRSQPSLPPVPPLRLDCGSDECAEQFSVTSN